MTGAGASGFVPTSRRAPVFGNPGRRRATPLGQVEGSLWSGLPSGSMWMAPLCLHIPGPACAPTFGGSMLETQPCSPGC